MANKIELNKEELKIVSSAIGRCWEQIACDVQDMGPCNNKQAIECCIDADRLFDFSKEADLLISKLLDDSGNYNTMLNYLSKNIRLV